MVRTSDEYLVPWDKNMISDQLIRETQLARTVFGLEPISTLFAEKIANEVERRVRLSKPKFVRGPMLREMSNNVLLEWSEEVPEFAIYRNLLPPVFFFLVCFSVGGCFWVCFVVWGVFLVFVGVVLPLNCTCIATELL